MKQFDPTKDEAPTLPGDEAPSETPSTTKGNHVNIMTLQAQQPDGQPVTMTSREIAELTGKAHFNVLADIRKMLAELKEDELKFQAIYLDSMNRQQTEFVLDRELTDTLLTGYSAIARRAVIARWRKLEAGNSAPTALDLRDPVQLAQVTTQLLALTNEQAAHIVGLKHQIEVDAPKVDGFERIALSDGDMTISMAGKILGIDPLKRLFSWMQEEGWIFKPVGSNTWRGHQDKVKRGLIDHRNYTKRLDDGAERNYPAVVVTPKGLALLAQQVPKELSMPLRRNGYAQPYQPGASA